MVIADIKHASCVLVSLALSHLIEAVPSSTYPKHLNCHYLPSDPEWPSHQTWNALNKTVNGNLLPGIPLARPCYNPGLNSARCGIVQEDYTKWDFLLATLLSIWVTVSAFADKVAIV